MTYSVITEKQEIYKTIRFNREIVFMGIDEENKYIELENAATFRFKGMWKKVEEEKSKFDKIFDRQPIKYVNINDESQYLRLIRDNYSDIESKLPVLSGMA